MESLRLSPPSQVSLSGFHKTRYSELQRFKSRRLVVNCHGDGGGGGGGGCSSIRTSAVPSSLVGRTTLSSENDSLSSAMEAANGSLNQPDADISPWQLSGCASNEGIGIIKFLRGKVLFVTGATGFLGKVLVEKILRTVPEIGKIYILIKARDKDAAMGRMKAEIMQSDLFKCIRGSYGKSFESFMMRKVVPLIGNVCESDLGLDDQTANLITSEIDIILNSAASTTFDERYDVAFNINTRGPSNLMAFAKRCHNLKLFSHVSTAYVNGQRQGRIMEKPFILGDSIAAEAKRFNGSSTSAVEKLDIICEMGLIKELLLSSEENQVTENMRALGSKRAKLHGWQDTYVFTKAMGEMLIDDMRGEVPVVIIRPSIIESTCKDPFPGWMEGNRMLDPIILYYGKGQLTSFLAEPDGVVDVIPADMVVNATLTAMAKHGMSQKPGLNVYQIASSVANPLVFKDLAAMVSEHYRCYPHVDTTGRPIHVPRMKLHTSMDDFAKHLKRDVSQNMEKNKEERRHDISRRAFEQVRYLARIYEPYGFYAGRFDNSNSERLFSCMSNNEKREFGFQVKNIDWEDYIVKVHIPGLRKHVMKGRGMR